MASVAAASKWSHFFLRPATIAFASVSLTPRNLSVLVFSHGSTLSVLPLTPQRLLGHSRLSTTTTYLHVRQERLQQVSSALDLIDFSRARQAA